jgi:transposase-like protein
MSRKARVERTPEEKWQIVQEGLKSGNVSETCRRFGIAPTFFYRWKDEAEQGAKAALGGEARRPRKPRKTAASLISTLVPASVYIRSNCPGGVVLERWCQSVREMVSEFRRLNPGTIREHQAFPSLSCRAFAFLRIPASPCNPRSRCSVTAEAAVPLTFTCPSILEYFNISTPTRRTSALVREWSQ